MSGSAIRSFTTCEDNRVTGPSSASLGVRRSANLDVGTRVPSATIATVATRPAVAEATVVVVNPIHLAVALAWDPSMDAPRLVAKGERKAGERIREAALEHGVPVVERTDLARRLFKKVDLGQPVPPELYGDVAELLAYVARSRGLALTS